MGNAVTRRGGAFPTSTPSSYAADYTAPARPCDFGAPLTGFGRRTEFRLGRGTAATPQLRLAVREPEHPPARAVGHRGHWRRNTRLGALRLERGTRRTPRP